MSAEWWFWLGSLFVNFACSPCAWAGFQLEADSRLEIPHRGALPTVYSWPLRWTPAPTQCFAGTGCTRKPASDKHFMLFSTTGVVFLTWLPYCLSPSSNWVIDWQLTSGRCGWATPKSKSATELDSRSHNRVANYVGGRPVNQLVGTRQRSCETGRTRCARWPVHPSCLE